MCEKTHNSSSWSLYLSVNVQSKTKAWRLISAIAEQGTITAKHVSLVTYTGSHNNFMGSETNPIGQQVKRRLKVGHWLSPADLSHLQRLWRAAEEHSSRPGRQIKASNVKRRVNPDCQP